MDSNDVSVPAAEASSAPAARSNNDYYREGFASMTRLVNIQALIMLGIAAFFAFYVNSDKDGDRYFAETGEGKRIYMPALDLPNMSIGTMSSWVSTAASEIMTFGFNDMEKRFQESRKDFTPDGWDGFAEAMINSGFADEMIAVQQIVTTVPASPATLVKEGLDQNGLYSWSFDVPLLMTLRSGGVKESIPRTVHITIERVSTEDNPNAIGISEWKLY
jgi:hypothetical protein